MNKIIGIRQVYEKTYTQEEVDKKIRESARVQSQALVTYLHTIKYNYLKRVTATNKYIEENRDSIDPNELGMILEYFSSHTLDEIDSSINVLETASAVLESHENTKH